MEEVTLGSLLLRGALILILLAANAFFVAAEFALVASRKTRIEEMVRQGDRKAKTVQAALNDLYRQLSAAQLGITLASILLGYVAEETVAVILRDWVSALPSALSFLGRAAFVSIIAVSVITALHVVVGEQAPKAMAIKFPEKTSRWAAAPLIFFSWITRPVTNFLNFSSNRLVRLMGMKDTEQGHGRVHSPDEIVMLVKKTKDAGRLNDDDVRMIEGVFEFTEKTVSQVMTHRTHVTGLSDDLSVEQAADAVAEVGRSRYPVFRESLDDVVGIIHVKQLLAALRKDPSARITTLMREPLFVPGTREVEDVLADLKRLKTHMAVVLGEYGGTAGIATMEDLIEEIVGEIYDEYDETELTPTSNGDFITVPGDAELEDLNRQFDLSLEDDAYQTIGGFVFGKLGRLPIQGDVVELKDATLEVLQMEGRRIDSVKVTPQQRLDT
jgi:CBS domain containing-hemolysin-like protein